MTKKGINIVVYCILIIMLGWPAYGQTQEDKGIHLTPHIVFLINNDPLNYGATASIPHFTDLLEKRISCTTSILISSTPNNTANLENIQAIQNGDLLVIFCRRIALPKHQMDIIQNYIKAGKPVIGIRSANHAFSVRDSLSEGYVDWWEFVPDVLGCENRGHNPNREPVKVLSSPTQIDHPIIQNIDFNSWTSPGQLYRSLPLLDPHAQIIIVGECDGLKEPLAWTRTTKYNGQVFYTVLGENEDFENTQFKTLLLNAIQWIL